MTQNYDPSATIKWYDDQSANYDQTNYTQDDKNYGGDAYRIQLVKQIIDKYKPKTILDIGCGTGAPMMELMRAGYDVRGFDFSPGMIDQAKKKLVEAGYSADLAEVGDLLSDDIVDRFGRGQYDAVVANGVLPYIAERDKPHRALTDFLKPGGLYIGAYSNELFDLATFNRFSVDFHKRNFIDPLPISADKKARYTKAIANLVTNPDVPKSIPEGGRDYIFLRSDNPLALVEELKPFGLTQLELFFYKFHAFPPLLKNVNDESYDIFMKNSRAYEIERAQDWRGHFLASTFITVCRKS